MIGKLWVKLYKKNKIKKDVIIECSKSDINDAMLTACKSLDLSQPIWTLKNNKEWANHQMTRFLPDDFMDEHDFDFMEINYIQPDKDKKTTEF